MSQIIINYDLIHTIKEAKGIKKCSREMSIISNSLAMLYPINVFSTSILDECQSEVVIGSTAIAAAIMIGLEQLVLTIGKETNMDFAKKKLDFLSKDLNNLNVYTNLELLLNSQIYYKEYKLINDGIRGIIRNRYINIPSYNYNSNKEVMSSIKEEHVLNSKKYILSLTTSDKK